MSGEHGVWLEVVLGQNLQLSAAETVLRQMERQRHRKSRESFGSQSMARFGLPSRQSSACLGLLVKVLLLGKSFYVRGHCDLVGPKADKKIKQVRV